MSGAGELICYDFVLGDMKFAMVNWFVDQFDKISCVNSAATFRCMHSLGLHFGYQYFYWCKFLQEKPDVKLFASFNYAKGEI